MNYHDMYLKEKKRKNTQSIKENTWKKWHCAVGQVTISLQK